MKPVLILLLCCQLCFFNQAGAQKYAYPLRGVGVETGMQLLGNWGKPLNLPDGKMTRDDYVYIDLSPNLSKAEKKKYGKSPLPEIELRYEGELKNNTFHGFGKLSFVTSNCGYDNWIYTGEFERGKANGYGELKCMYLYPKPNYLHDCYFRGEFRDGIPVEGTMILNFHRAKKNTATVFYTGQVLFEKSRLSWHGFGSLLRFEMDHEDPKYSVNSGIRGAFYMGQFYKGSATGFGISNTVDSVGRLGTLKTVLTGADDIFFQYEDLKLYADFLTGTPYAAPTGTSALYRLFPQIDKAAYKELSISKDIVYKGMVLDNQPYGLGLVEYPGDQGLYRDISFWKQGLKISPADALKKLLPDSNWLIAKPITPYIRQCWNNWNEKLYKLEATCTDAFRKAVYYGPVSDKGYPLGWGWMHTADENANRFTPLLGKFSGVNPELDKSTTLGAERLYHYAYNQQWKYNYYDPKLAALDQYYSEFEGGVFDQEYPVVKPVNFKRNFTRIAFAEDQFMEEKHVNYVKFERDFKSQLAARPTFRLQTFYRSKTNMSSSYIQNDQGQQLKGLYVSRENIQRGDYVFLGAAFYYVHDSYRNIMLGKTNLDGVWSVAGIPENVFVIRGYQLDGIEHRLAYCSGCSNLPSVSNEPVTITGSAHSGRYETNVYQNNSGGGTIVSKAIYNQISITLPPPTRKPCKVCNDLRKSEKVPVKIVEI